MKRSFGDESSDRISFEPDETLIEAILEKITGIAGVDVLEQFYHLV